MSSVRQALTVTVTGLISAMGWSQVGKVSIGTKALDTKVNGKIQMKPAAWTNSGSFTAIPIRAEIQLNEYPNRTTSTSIRRYAGSPPDSGANPTRTPTTVISTTTNMFRIMSAKVRPARTAERAIGNERKRSISPRPRSSARPTPVAVAPNTAVWTKIPGIRKLT